MAACRPERVEFAPNTPGTYRWVVDYSGDRDNDPAATECGDEEETISFERETEPSHPELSTVASVPGRIGARHPIRAAGLPIHDAAALSGGAAPTGEITFYLYGPNDATCSKTSLVFTTATEVKGNGVYNSEAFTPAAPGIYRWVAAYTGDVRNHPAGPTICDDKEEQANVTDPADPQLTSSASEAVTIGGAIHDTAHLNGGSNPSGTITFQLHGPSDESCTGHPIFTSTVTVTGNNDYTSQSFIPTAPGGYRWVESYSGDSHNHPAGPTACGDSAELAIVRPTNITPVAPAFSTTACSPFPVTAAVAVGLDGCTLALGQGASPSTRPTPRSPWL